jgi:transcription elongation GreA/GreB family factor
LDSCDGARYLPARVNKTAVLEKIVERLAADLEVYFKAAKAAHFEATHEQSKAENKYDTRGLEASYLARGQSKQAAELEQSLEQYRALSVREFTAGTPVDIGALVELAVGRERSWYFLGPRAGGTEVIHGGYEILVITPQAPIGQLLVGRRQGESVRLTFGAKAEAKLVSVS